VSSSSSPSPRDDERPLDDRETREFDLLVAGYRRRVRRSRRSGRPPAPVLRARTVVLVLLASSVLAVLSAMLPAPANLWSPVGLLVGVALGSLAWALRPGRQRSGR
jgi:hypothetical protein